MCEGFGTIVMQDGNGQFEIFFIEPPLNGDVSHHMILQRLGKIRKLVDNSVLTRNYVRTEHVKWTIESFRFDEPWSMPGWAKSNKYEIESACNKLMLRVKTIFDDYRQKQRALRQKYKKEHGKLYRGRYYNYQTKEYEYFRPDPLVVKEYQAVRESNKQQFVKQLSRIKGYIPVTE